MSIDIAQEELIRLSDVPKLKCMPRGAREAKRLSIATIYRWALGGTGGVNLEILKVGGSLCTSLEALQRFFDALTPNATENGLIGPRTAVHIPAWRRRQMDAVDRELDAILGPKSRPVRSAREREIDAKLVEARKNPNLAHLSPKRLREYLEAERQLDEAGI